ncbi:MAG: 2-C-methyl-D-erythritol 2,4-cyclodiphosphate synthase [Bacteroidales bacterium]|nr:2-C-methyl-D-erythritol 2,4-cyclodiphosphate synthase [Bacteroidales bacterium]
MPRIGNGFDVHRFAENRELWLCGVKVPYELGLLGHSDADVALHALSDALLGAAALRDIGYHFPDTDPTYKGADSRVLLRRIVEIIAEKGYRIGNVDVTIIAQAPKLLPYIEQMRETVAADLGIALDCVSIKATTTERLGFTGRREGIAAQATALIV